MVAATWLMAFGALMPTWRGAWGTFGLDVSIGSCSILPDKNRKTASTQQRSKLQRFQRFFFLDSPQKIRQKISSLSWPSSCRVWPLSSVMLAFSTSFARRQCDRTNRPPPPHWPPPDPCTSSRKHRLNCEKQNRWPPLSIFKWQRPPLTRPINS